MTQPSVILATVDKLQKLTDVKADTMRLIFPQLSGKGSRMLHPFSDEHSCLSLQEASISMGKSVRMMGAPEDEVDRVIQNSKVDQRIIGFSEEERRLRQRTLDGPSRVPIRLPQGPYIFCDFRTLQLPGVELHPPAFEALRRMHMLASDPGIVAIMSKHQWRVGIMTEMAPIGYVGVSPKCILGTELISGDQNGNIRVWDLTANSCSCKLVPEVDTAVRSLTVMWDGSLVVAANNHGTCYVWRLLKGNQGSCKSTAPIEQQPSPAASA